MFYALIGNVSTDHYYFLTHTHIHILIIFFNFQDRYVAICTKKGIDPKSTHLQFWIEAVGGIKKNSIQGHPRLRASDICGIFFMFYMF